MQGNGWIEWKNHVLAELERLNETNREQDQKLSRILQDIAMLKMKAGIFGALFGGVVSSAVVIISKFI